MKLQFSIQDFSWNGTMGVFDPGGHLRYRITGDGFRLGKRIYIRDLADQQAVYIRQIVPTMIPQYELEVYGRPVGTLLRCAEGYYLRECGWLVQQTAPGTWEVTEAGEVIAACCADETDRDKIWLDPGTGGMKALGALFCACVMGNGKI